MSSEPSTSEPCHQCGRETEFRRKGTVQGFFCKHCGWSAVTSYIPALYLDNTVYEVRACGGDYKDKRHISAVADLSGRNFLEARKLLEQDAPVVFKGKAPEVLRARDVLVAAGLGCYVEPPFPHIDPT